MKESPPPAKKTSLELLEASVELATGRKADEIRRTPLSEWPVNKENRARFERELEQMLDNALS